MTPPPIPMSSVATKILPTVFSSLNTCLMLFHDSYSKSEKLEKIMSFHTFYFEIIKRGNNISAAGAFY